MGDVALGWQFGLCHRAGERGGAAGAWSREDDCGGDWTRSGRVIYSDRGGAQETGAGDRSESAPHVFGGGVDPLEGFDAQSLADTVDELDDCVD